MANWHRDMSRRQSVSLDAAIDTPDPGRSLADHAEGNEETRSLWEVIRRLPPERQQLLVLKFVDELSTEQIAIIMGRSEGAVKALLHRTLAAMRGQLSEPAQGDDSQP